MSAFTEANRKAFEQVLSSNSIIMKNILTQYSELATSYNTKPWQQALTAQFTKELHTRREWLGLRTLSSSPSGSKLFDYACGTGAVTNALGSDFSTIRGIDISEKMVELYNTAAQSSESKDRPVAVVGDLLSTPPSSELQGEDWQDFDLAVICAGFHHFENPGEAVKRLVERLRPGGQLLIIDFLPFDDEVDRERKLREQMEHTHGPGHDFPDMTHTIKHSGFNETHMRDFYTAAGLTDIGFNLAAEASTMELKNGKVERHMFFAKGRKSA